MADSLPLTVVIGAGPAGLTAALELTRAGAPCIVLEEDPEYVGGIARTVRYKDFRLDIGGHRFYTKVREVEQFWQEILAGDLLEVVRQSRIYYKRKFFDYPLKGRDVFVKLGLINSALCGLSHFYRKANPIRPEVSFRDWVTNRFGDRLYRTFFESYTEKVWGIKCTEISADWAAERIQGLSVMRILKSVISKAAAENDAAFKTLIDHFHYPRLGCGMLWEKSRELIERGGNQVVLDRRVVKLTRDGQRIRSVICQDSGGGIHEYEAGHVISSMALRDLARAISPAPPPEISRAAESLRYRDFITVALAVRSHIDFPDQWIYIHDPGVKLGRIQNFRNWSPEMVPDPEVTLLGLEYFCFEGDGMWTTPDEELIRLGSEELERIGLGRKEDVTDGTVVRMPKAYPIYDDHYKDHVHTVAQWLKSMDNLASAGRNAMHQYNNQDHSMMAAMISARNILRTDDRDPWNVNHNAEYLEERRTPQRLSADPEVVEVS